MVTHEGEKIILTITEEGYNPGCVSIRTIATDPHGQVYSGSFTQKKMYGRSRIKAFKEATKVAKARAEEIVALEYHEAHKLINEEVKLKTGYEPAWNYYHMPD